MSNEAATLSLVRRLTSSSYELQASPSSMGALQGHPLQPSPDLVLFEPTEAGAHVMRTLPQLLALYPKAAVIVLASPGHTPQLVEAIHMGAKDYLITPLQDTELQLVLQRHLGPHPTSTDGTPLTSSIEELGDDQYVVAGSSIMRKLRMQAELVSDINVPVLILGESGTGKEVTARLLHKLSPRATHPFLKVNCAALPADLLESELFGYERGAFTGATRTKLGKFELCHEGTILLDEIGDMPAALQAKLLHVLQDKKFFRLGGERPVEVDVRILAATNVDIAQALSDHKLREDLYYRLAAFMLYLPPLRERSEDIPLLLQYFMNRLAKDYGRPPLPISPALLEVCMRYKWPGNLRELENFVKRYLVLGDERLGMDGLCNSAPLPTDLPPTEKNNGNGTINDRDAACGLKSVLRSLKVETEIDIITHALQQAGWNRKRAAQLLNISYRGLLYKLRQYNLKSPFSVSTTSGLLKNGN